MKVKETRGKDWEGLGTESIPYQSQVTDHLSKPSF